MKLSHLEGSYKDIFISLTSLRACVIPIAKPAGPPQGPKSVAAMKEAAEMFADRAEPMNGLVHGARAPAAADRSRR
jgi:hypothetical protein